MNLYVVANVGRDPVAVEISEADVVFGPRLTAVSKLISRKQGRHFVVRAAGLEIVEVRAAPRDWVGGLIACVDRSARLAAVQDCRKRITPGRIDRYLDRQRVSRLPDLFGEIA